VSSSYAVVHPDVQAWADLPRRVSTRRQTIIAWLIALVTTAGAFVADRGWETLDDDAWEGAYRTLDMFGLASILLAGLFAVGGWGLRRHAVAAAPLVLAFAAIPHTLDGYASAGAWWAGFTVSALWAVSQARVSLQQLRAVSAVARVSNSQRTAELGPHAAESVKQALRRRLAGALLFTAVAAAAWFAAFAVLPSEIGRTYQEAGEESLSDLLAGAAAGASIMAITAWMRQGWTAFARFTVGPRLVWEIPSTGGPVSAPPFMPYGPGLIPVNETSSAACICRAELLRAAPDIDDDVLEAEGVYPSDYCPAHGIDRVNRLSTEEFRLRAHHPWLWAEGSDIPSPLSTASNRSLLVGFAGHAFTGVPALPRDGKVDAWMPGGDLAEETTQGERAPVWDKPQRPSAGVLDRIDLHPAGYDGYAIRYRHGRAWYEPSDTPAPACKTNNDGK
jgi:hypothetical protein